MAIYHRSLHQSGFSLVELSIVLVILGLLTGGILAGQNLIRAAELRAVTSEYNRFTTATQTFRDQYFALPGDIPNAFDYWGAAVGCTDVDVGANQNGCNGNGDGLIDNSVNGGTGGENLRFWQHLALAGLIEGSYSGVSSGSVWGYDGTNTPRSKLSNGLWGMWASDLNNVSGDYNWLDFAALQASGQYPQNPVLRPEEAWNIDTKMDDGVANGGQVGAMPYGPVTACYDGGAIGPDYALSSTAISCGMKFLLHK